MHADTLSEFLNVLQQVLQPMVLFCFPTANRGVKDTYQKHFFFNNVQYILTSIIHFTLYFIQVNTIWPLGFTSPELLELFQNSSLEPLIPVKDTH